ncbi:hypothetical protein ON010_g946 [Phytophthora cinnamomi]|nr:hypothetical protein ON010_g946 [Phytophthora cinnamomi]
MHTARLSWSISTSGAQSTIKYFLAITEAVVLSVAGVTTAPSIESAGNSADSASLDVAHTHQGTFLSTQSIRVQQ